MAKSIEGRIRDAVERIRDANQAYFEAEFDEDSPQELGEPATAAQIQKLEQQLKISLPPSYAAFLRTNNGWKNVSGGAMLLPTEEHAEPWVSQRSARIREHFKEFHGSVSLDRAVFVQLGEDEKDFVYLDLAVQHGGGEVDVVYADLEDGELDRFPDFAAFLEDTADTAEELLEEDN